MERLTIDEGGDDRDRSPVWKLSIEEFERAAEDEGHPLHEDAVKATREIGEKLSAALAPIVRSTNSGMEEALANVAKHAMGAIDWNEPLRKLSLKLAADFPISRGPELLRVHDPSSDIDIVSQVPENMNMGDAVGVMEGKLDDMVDALRERTAQADRHSAERRDESEGSLEIAKRGLAVSRVSFLATKRTLKISMWMLVAGGVAAVSGIGAIIVGLMTLAATGK